MTPNVVSESDFLRMDPQKWMLFKSGFVLLRDKCKKKVLVALNDTLHSSAHCSRIIRSLFIIFTAVTGSEKV